MRSRTCGTMKTPFRRERTNVDKVTVTVTAEDIGTPGVRDDNGACAIDRTMMRMDPTTRPATGYSLTALGDKTYKLPVEAQIFIMSWDKGKQVEPFTFVMTRAY